jgi:sugar phosphate isomerase/epimerase
MKFSMFTVILPELTPEQAACELKKGGYDGVEWRIKEDYHFPLEGLKNKAGDIKKLTADNGLQISNLGSYVSVFDTKNIKSLAEAARVMGAPSFRVWLPGYNEIKKYKSFKNKVRKQLEKLSPLLEKIKVKLMIEIHHVTLIPSANAAFSLLNGLPPKSFGVIYDPGNMIIEGRESWRMGLDLLGPYLAYIHVKNAEWRQVKGKWEHLWAPTDGGIADWSEIMNILVERNYKGFLSVENLYRVPLKTRGLVNEKLKQKTEKVRSWKKRIYEDITYLKKLYARAKKK